MSYDFLIVTRRRPAPDTIEAFAVAKVVWYGPEYAPLVRPLLADVATDREGGILVRHGILPMDTDELAGAPRIPFELIGPIARTVPAIE